LILQGGRLSGHGLLEPTPRIYQLTPDIPDRRRATKQEQVRPQIWPTASKRVNSPPVGTFSPASDVTDEANSNSKPQSGSGVTVAPLPPAPLVLVQNAAAGVPYPGRTPA
jgi:hypothetical protein